MNAKLRKGKKALKKERKKSSGNFPSLSSNEKYAIKNANNSDDDCR